MVEINNKNKNISIKIKTYGNSVSVLPHNDSSNYYSALSKDWACKEKASVDGSEYSSKYYAQISKNIKEQLSNNPKIKIISEDLLGKKNIELCATNIDAINNASKNAQLAENQAQIATEQAKIAKDKVNEITSVSNSKLNTNLDNINESGIKTIKHISNALDGKITNCITEIPQDIKLELKNGNLIVRAGSKVHYLDGTSRIISQDIVTAGVSVTPEQRFFWVSGNTGYGDGAVTECFSGNNATMNAISSPKSYQTFFNTEQKKAFSGDGSKWIERDYSLPIALATNEPNKWKSIDQVFNGFGFMGSTIFALPNVKGLIPNGRNADGSLKSIEDINTSVLIRTYTTETANNIMFNKQDNFIGGLSGGAYDEVNNHLIKKSDGTIQLGYVFATADLEKGKITNFVLKTSFHALDYSDKSTISGFGMPSDKFIRLTLGASETGYVAPANGWFGLTLKTGSGGGMVSLKNDTALLYTQLFSPTSTALQLFMPAKKGQSVRVYYTSKGASEYNTIKFVYAEGEV